MTALASTHVSVDDAVQALAFIGDLSMGRPTDHSLRTARLAMQLAAADGGGESEARTAHAVALLRWSGCTANAVGFDQLFGDDVAGRDAMLSMTLPPAAGRADAITPLAEIHCEVSGDIAAQLGMEAAVETGLRRIFETWDGRGGPAGLAAQEVPSVVYHVALASDLEILSRAHGLPSALSLIGRLADAKYPAHLVSIVAETAAAWLGRLEAEEETEEEAEEETVARAASGMDASRAIPLELIADVSDLKLPWLAGQSRQVAECARTAAALLGLGMDAQTLLQRAGLLHSIGRAALPNHLWERPGRLSMSDRERIQLMPYWTYRAAGIIKGLGSEAELASYAYERLDGSGYYRNLRGQALSMEHRILAAAVALIALRSRRPWRPAYPADEAAHLLRADADKGRFDPAAVDAAIAALAGGRAPAAARSTPLLSAREAEVLQRVSLGESNKEVARSLDISPSTVRTHIESVFRKLGCSTRAAATLKAFTLGLL